MRVPLHKGVAWTIYLAIVALLIFAASLHQKAESHQHCLFSHALESSLRPTTCTFTQPISSSFSKACGKCYPYSDKLRYINGSTLIAGWMEPISAYLAAYFTLVQREWKIYGGIAEIGVHHGKFFLALVLSSWQEEQHIAIDLFENQEANIDNSGKGNKEMLLQHLQDYSVERSEIQLINGSSADLSDRTIKATRLWSVDGGHTPELTWNDLVRNFFF